MLPSINGSSTSGGPDEWPTFVTRFDSERTTIVPQVAGPGRVRAVLPWAGFGVVAVVVVAATTVWASNLRGPDDAAAVTAVPPPVTVSPAPIAPIPSPVLSTAPAAAATVAVRKRSAAPVRPTLARVPVLPVPAAPPPVAAATSAAVTSSVKPTVSRKPAAGSADESTDPASESGSTASNATPP